MIEDLLKDALLDLARRRKLGSTFCPSEAARAVTRDWHPLMPDVRRLAEEIGLIATQKGVVVNPVEARGPIRLQRPEAWHQ